MPLALLCVLAVFGRLASSHWAAWQEALGAMGPAAPLCYLGLWLALVPWGFPAAALGLSAGFLFGAWPGVAWALAGLTLSGLMMFPLGRHLLRPRIRRLTNASPRLARLEGAAARGGVKLHVLARLSPLNYALVSYTMAAGGASLRTYVPGLLGAMPGLGVYVWLGATAGQGARGTGPAGATRLILSLVGGLSLLILVILSARMARRALAAADVNDPPAD